MTDERASSPLSLHPRHGSVVTPTKFGGIVKQVEQSSPSSATSKSKRKLDLIAPDSAASPRKKERVLSSSTRIFIISDKLSENEIEKLREQVVQSGGMNSSLAYANLILTKLRSEKRILRSLNEEVQSRNVPVLHLSWLYDSIEEKLMQPFLDKYRPLKYTPGAPGTREAIFSVSSLFSSDHDRSNAEMTGNTEMTGKDNSEKADRNDEEEEDSVTEDEEEGNYGSREGSLDIPDQVDEEVDGMSSAIASSSVHDQGPAWQNVEYACLRPSPLQSKYNQDLVDELEILRLQRIQSGKQEMNATAYGRAISAIKALPFALAPNPSKAKFVKGIGPKIAKLVQQFYKVGSIAETESIRKDAAFQSMTQFMELYGVGPKRAREYYSQGARTLDDVIRMGGSMGTHLHIEECLRILPDLRCKIPRREVMEIADLIQTELDKIRPGCLHTICGGFRRGKLESNDVDIVITDPNPTNFFSQITCMEDLLRQLKKTALITHVVNVTTPSSTFEAVYSHLDIAEVVMLPPTSSIVSVPRHRRVDIIFCPYRTYGAAVLGWTGSRQFERDLRLLAKHRGFRFHSTGIVNQNETNPYDTPREEDVFELLQIPYMPPHLRNCDA